MIISFHILAAIVMTINMHWYWKNEISSNYQRYREIQSWNYVICKFYTDVEDKK